MSLRLQRAVAAELAILDRNLARADRDVERYGAALSEAERSRSAIQSRIDQLVHVAPDLRIRPSIPAPTTLTGLRGRQVRVTAVRAALDLWGPGRPFQSAILHAHLARAGVRIAGEKDGADVLTVQLHRSPLVQVVSRGRMVVDPDALAAARRNADEARSTLRIQTSADGARAAARSLSRAESRLREVEDVLGLRAA